ncbi:hypothetical protein GMORB2_4941 [Geosmithia morbida]|uniref:Xaa-Pro aminopeptidase n=1 Tax=Geosmithia morbida TaxID=1094350 RepID=A0A9P4YPH1_9HYPO|nr:uncharacterized protein GMORB2_4941 [Geosmithia morbida]KAF4119422.1 hypothetical protein GMORB2_4941 [Geosmithia morbida]
MVAENFEAVLKGKYPAKDHAKRVTELLREKVPGVNGFIYLESTMTKMQEDNDSPVPFRQRRFFHYLTGCNEADCFFIYDIQSSKSTLFIPPIDPDDVIWSGLPLSIDEALAKYDVDDVRFTTDINKALSSFSTANPGSTVFSIDGQVSDHIDLSIFSKKNLSAVKEIINRSRVVKDEYEVALIRKANQISGWAHKAVVEKARTAKNESELEAAFLEKCVAHGAKEMAYHPILASGRAAATLHYVNNSAPLHGKINLLIDAGAEWENYSSDITRTFPLNGKFTPDSRALYDIVYRMQQEAIEQIKPGVLWDDVHTHAHKVAIEGLLSLGVLKGDKDEIFESRTSAAFFPHGLGHYLGLDTHDVGGNPNSSDKDILFRYLRLRNKLEAGAVVTVEPGIYFCEFIIKPYLEDPKHSKFINKEVLDRFWDVGGVRIEDNILVTETGYENLTDAIKEPSEIEAIFSN